MFKVEFKTGGAAFCSPFTGEEDRYIACEETARKLREIADRLEDGYMHGVIMDTNGFSIGEFKLD